MGLVVLFLIGIIQVVILNVCVDFKTYGLSLLWSFATLLPFLGIISMVVAFCNAGEYDPRSQFYVGYDYRLRSFVLDNKFTKWLTKERW